MKAQKRGILMFDVLDDKKSKKRRLKIVTDLVG